MPPPTTIYCHSPTFTTTHRHHSPPPTATIHHHPPPPTTIHQHPPPSAHRLPKYINHHLPQPKIYPSKKVFYKKNIKIFYSEVRNLTSRPAIAKKLFFFIWPSLLILLRTQEMVSLNKPLHYVKLVCF